jgi:hypothetical protein
MATEPGDPDIDRWLDGLAGRPGSGASHAGAERLRHALQPEGQATSPKLSWAEIEQRAAAQRTPEVAAAPSPLEAPRPAAANDGMWRPWQGWAAAVLVAACLALVMQQREPEPVLRGGGSAAARWVVDNPQAAAQSLATELRALGAGVEVENTGPQVILRLRATGAAAAAVNRRLGALETSLDASGTLVLNVTAR